MNVSDAMNRMTEAMASDPSLREKLKEAVEASKSDNLKSPAELIAKAAQAIGYDVTVEDCEQLYSDVQPLDEELLDQVTGGSRTNPDGPDARHCGSDYWCDVWYFHDLWQHDKKTTQCLADYWCDHIWN